MEQDLPTVTVIVLNYNGKRFLRECIQSVSRSNYPKDLFQVILADNGSQDGSVDFVRKNFPWVRIIEFSRNWGFGGGNNRAAQQATGEYLVFLNNDTKPEPKWLEALLENRHRGYRILAAKTLFLQDPEIVEYGGGLLLPNGRGVSARFGERDNRDNGSAETGYPCAAAMMIQRDAFFKLGGFDEDYVAALDDTDLGWRAWLTGFGTLFCPRSIVFHLSGGTTGDQLSRTKLYHGTKNAYANLIKNLEFRHLGVGFALAFCYDISELLMILRRGNAPGARSKAAAYLWVLRNKRRLFLKRSLIQANRVNSDKFLSEKGFLLGRTRSLRQYFALRSAQSTMKRNA